MKRFTYKATLPADGTGVLSAGVFMLSAAMFASQVLLAHSAAAQQYNGVDETFKTPAIISSTDLPVRVRGLVVPRRQARISAAFPATILSIGPDNGDRFSKGDVLVSFDCGINQAELNRANAIADAARDTLQVRRKLAASGSISRLQVILAAAERRKADADVVVARTRVAYCRVSAPFSGRVVRRIANAYETVAPRDPLLEIVDDSDVEIRVFIPSIWLKNLKVDDSFDFKVDETGETLALKIVALGASIDNVSQLIEVRGRVVETQTALLAGMSGSASFTHEIAVSQASQGTSN